MAKLLFFILVFSYTDQVYSSEEYVYNVYYWDVSPLISADKQTGKVQGVIPDVLNNIKPRCSSSVGDKKINFVNYTEMSSEHELLEAMTMQTTESLRGALWGPFLTHSISSNEFTSFCAKNGIVPRKLIQMDGMAVLVREERLFIVSKVLSGLFRLISVYLLFLMTCIIAGLFFWIIDQSKQKDLSFSEGIISSIWWSFITMTTVGYGDITPNTKLGRLFAITWMYYAMIVFCMVTGIVTTLVFDDSLFDISHQNIAVLEHSFENEIGIATYDINSFEFETYDGVLAAVKDNDEIFAGLVPSYIASWRYAEIQSKGLRVVAIHPLTLYAFLLEMNTDIPSSLPTNSTSEIEELSRQCRQFTYDYIYKVSVKGTYQRYLEKTLYLINPPKQLLTKPHFYVTIIILVVLCGICAFYDILRNKVKRLISRSSGS